ncbi:tetratricopeptide repeat protein [Aquibium sp. A9E412]|uniref:tetratricopeptide repeat protein n=1 Tax=Aquibium sp. A9E412 TaxID=2976767 RepID=UPI0025AF9B78|nr:tetratricopeptide repeat protein [Aquibium sp. A9E412]MDN2565451.1 tetratricopeptide repeat protein [Aquibium sp. A9E412]
MPRSAIGILGALALAAPLAAGPAWAAGGGGGGGGNAATQCTNGKVWDSRQQKCVDPQDSRLDTETLYAAGRDLARAERYGEAIRVLSLAADRGDPRILNYLGYAHRKQGRVRVGLGYYQEALAIDPDFTLAREYLGEAYLQMGDVAAAERQLGEIAARCGTGCAEHAELERQIAAHVAGG